MGQAVIDYCFNPSLAAGYKSGTQRARVMSEAWVGANVFCPSCGNPHITHLANNRPVADFMCDSCGEIFELKSKCGQIGNIIPDGAYDTMMSRITSNANPDLFVLQYSKDLRVTRLTCVPKFFFVPSVIQKRKPLPPSAKRAGWVGCNILYGNIPTQGKLPLISDGHLVNIGDAVTGYARLRRLQTRRIEARGWLLDVLTCVNRIDSQDFSLSDMYAFEDALQHLHPENHNIRPKIRQQLQLLRDKGFIEFIGRGKYRKATE